MRSDSADHAGVPSSRDSALPMPPDQMLGSPLPTDTVAARTGDDILINALQWTFNQWDTARAPHRANWENAWRLFNNQWDFHDKEDWQSKRCLPKVMMTVKRLSATITRIISLSSDWFGAETSSPSKQKYINFVKDIMYNFLDDDNADFESIFSDAIEVGMLSQIMPVMCTWNVDGWSHPTATDDAAVMMEALAQPTNDRGMPSEMLPQTPFDEVNTSKQAASARPTIRKPDGKLKFELLSPDNVILDPTGRNRGMIIERHYTRGEFAQEAETCGFINVEQVMAYDYNTMDKEVRENRKKGQIHTIDKDTVYLQTYWGSLYDHNGNCLLKNEYFIVANKAFIVLPPTPNPFWHDKIPVSVCGMLKVPFSTYHQGFISMNADTFELWVEFFNMTIDYFQKVLIGMNEIDMDALYDPDEQDADVAWPGKNWRVKGKDPVVRPVITQDLGQGVYPFFEMVKSELNDGTALSDATEGTPRTRGKQSAQEFTRRMAEAGVLLDYIYRNIEKNLIKPLLTLGFQTILQFMSKKDWAYWIDCRKEKYPELADEFENMKAMSAVERYNLLGTDISFQTKVFSAVFDRQAVIEKLTFFIGTTGRLPFVAQYIKWGGILKKLVEALGYDVEDIVSDIPIKPMSDIMAPGATESSTFGGSDGGESIPQQPPQAGQTENQAGGIMGVGEGQPPPGFSDLMPGARQSGNPKNK